MSFLSQFWSQYGDLVSLCVTVICFLLVLIIKKKKNLNEIDTILLDVFEKLPVWIQEVECPGNGEEKLATVLNAVKVYVQKKYSITLSSSVISRITFMIEDILETPQKNRNFLFRK